MLRRRLVVAGIIIFAEVLAVAPLKAGKDQGNGFNPSEVRATSAVKAAFNAPPEDLYSYPSLANGPSAAAPGVGIIRTQPAESKPHSARRSPLLIGLYVSYGILQVLDAQSTIRALHSGSAREGNPLVHPFAGRPAAFVAFKGGLAAGTIFGTDRLYKSRPRLAMITLAAINAGYVFVVARNYRSFPAR